MVALPRLRGGGPLWVLGSYKAFDIALWVSSSPLPQR